jgi:hypothetical protein
MGRTIQSAIGKTRGEFRLKVGEGGNSCDFRESFGSSPGVRFGRRCAQGRDDSLRAIA